MKSVLLFLSFTWRVVYTHVPPKAWSSFKQKTTGKNSVTRQTRDFNICLIIQVKLKQDRNKDLGIICNVSIINYDKVERL